MPQNRALDCQNGVGRVKHVHAELMMQYAQDAMETDDPWNRWELKNKTSVEWKPLAKSPSWFPYMEYRRKPNGKMVLIDEEEFIVPKCFYPNINEEYWYFDINGKVIQSVKKTGTDLLTAILGACYKTEAEAKQALAFWKKINEVTE